MDVRWHAQPLRTLRRMPKNEAQRIYRKIHQYAERPESLANRVKKLKGREGYRLRIGDWRVIVTEDGQVLTVLRVGPRGEVYK